MAIAEFQDGFITKTRLNELVGGINANTIEIEKIIILTENITKTVGTGGDFATLNLAINWCKKVIPNGYKVTLQLVAGFVMAESVLIESCDLRFVTITSSNMDAIVIDRGSITESYIFKGIKSYMPYIYDVNFTMNGTMSAGSTKTFMRLEGLGAYSGYIGTLNNIEYMARVYTCAEISFISNGGTSLYGYSFNFNAKGNVTGSFSATYLGFKVDWCSKASFGNGNLTLSAQGIEVSKMSEFSMPYGSITMIDANYKAFTVIEGGIIQANGTPGTLSQTANTITANGIIFQ